MTVEVRFTDFKTYTRAENLDKVTGEIRKATFDYLGRLELKKKVRLIGMRTSNLEQEEMTQ